MYSGVGRPSVAPERLLKGMGLMALYGVRSDRQLCEQLRYNMLFKWFLDMTMVEDAFDPSSFSHNRDRLLEHDVARQFFDQVVDRARRDGLLSSDPFSVDGTLIEAWGSPKSFRPREGDTQDNGGFVNFRGEKRLNDTHESKTDPEARLYRKGHGKEARLAHMGHVLIAPGSARATRASKAGRAADSRSRRTRATTRRTSCVAVATCASPLTSLATSTRGAARRSMAPPSRTPATA